MGHTSSFTKTDRQHEWQQAVIAYRPDARTCR